MTPLIPVGAELLIKKVPADYTLKRFDILLFKQDDKLVCHYFWQQITVLEKPMIVTRNLESGEFDYPFERKMLLGIVTNYKIGFFLKMKIFFKR